MSHVAPYHYHGRYDHTPVVDRVELTRVQFHRGTGCCEESPIRIVTAYYDDDGEALWERDPLPERVPESEEPR